MTMKIFIDITNRVRDYTDGEYAAWLDGMADALWLDNEGVDVTEALERMEQRHHTEEEAAPAPEPATATWVLSYRPQLGTVHLLTGVDEDRPACGTARLPRKFFVKPANIHRTTYQWSFTCDDGKQRNFCANCSWAGVATDFKQWVTSQSRQLD